MNECYSKFKNQPTKNALGKLQTIEYSSAAENPYSLSLYRSLAAGQALPARGHYQVQRFGR